MSDPTLWVDVERDAFAASRVHEYVFQVTDYKFTYESRLDLCIADLTAKLDRLQEHAPNHRMVLCLGHKENFRYAISPTYKSNRRGIRRAAASAALRQWMQRNYETAVLPGVEADDVLGIMYQPGDLLYSPDKDLRTIAGVHMLDNGELEEVKQLEADRQFFKQVLTGDSTDGYGGCPGIGGAAKVFESDDWVRCSHEEQFWDFVLWQYEKARKKLAEKHDVVSPAKYALTQARLARILRSGEYDFANEQPVLWNGPS